MNLTIILLIIGIIGGFIIGFFGCYGDFGEGILGALVGFVCAALISLILCGLLIPAIAEAEGANYVVEQTDVKPIYALKDNSSISGSFFLGTGSIDEDDYYYYVTREEGKGYIVNRIMVGGSTYLEYLTTEDCEYKEPCLVYFYTKWESKTLRFFAWSPSNWRTFYIPEGSIIENYYEVDLEG